jgi:hypothetical protein
VFVTSTSVAPGSYGGLAGADAMCQQRAMAVGLPGSYVAYLSTSTVNAVDRLGSARGWSRLDGRPVFDTVADIKANAMFYPPSYDELGGSVVGDVATGTTDTGVAYGQDCAGWTSTAGMTSAGDPHATNWSYGVVNPSCGTTYSIYCFGIDRNAPTAPPAIPSRRAFLTQGLWTSGNGLVTADNLCQSEATAASLPGTYLALLATGTTSAISRFDLAGPPWVRLDNTALAVSNAAFAGANLLDAPDMTTASTHVIAGVFTGAITPSTVGDPAWTCGGDWTVGNGSKKYIFGSSGAAGPAAFSSAFPPNVCSVPAHLYCLQQ